MGSNICSTILWGREQRCLLFTRTVSPEWYWSGIRNLNMVRYSSSSLISKRTLKALGFWRTPGYTYTDAVYIYAVSRAGYIPHLCWMGIDTSDLLHTLMEKVSSQAIIFDENAVGAKLANWPYSAILLPLDHSLSFQKSHNSVPSEDSLPEWAPQASDVALIIHTSGSVSGVPQPLKMTFRWEVNLLQSFKDFQTTYSNEKMYSAATFCHTMGLICQ